jgi:hypothetical protein
LYLPLAVDEPALFICINLAFARELHGIAYEIGDVASARHAASHRPQCAVGRAGGRSSAQPDAVRDGTRAAGLKPREAALCKIVAHFFEPALGRLFARRNFTPGSSLLVNWIRAFSKHEMIFSCVTGRPPSSPSTASSRRIVAIETPLSCDSFSCRHPSRSRAALICRIDILNIDIPNPLHDILNIAYRDLNCKDTA